MFPSCSRPVPVLFPSCSVLNPDHDATSTGGQAWWSSMVVKHSWRPGASALASCGRGGGAATSVPFVGRRPSASPTARIFSDFFGSLLVTLRLFLAALLSILTLVAKS